jgi:ABC-2 type transport system permease protein
MKFREIFRYELAYQVRRVTTWVYFVVLFLFGFLIMRSVEPEDGAFLNTPAFVAFFTLMSGVIWLLMAAPVAGGVAARDIETRIHPLTYTAPVSKTEYLGGRFLAAFVLNASMLLAIQVGFLLSCVLPGIRADLVGPFLPELATPFLFIALPNAFVASAIQFSVALRHGRAMAGYVASVLLIVTSLVIGTIVAELFEQRVLGKLIDFVGFFIIREMEALTPIERNTGAIVLQGTVFANRLVWIGVGIGALALTYRRFRFEHPFDSLRSLRAGQWIRIRRRTKPMADIAIAVSARIAIPDVQRSFGFATYARQTLTLAWTSFRAIAKSRTGLTLIGVLALGSAFVSTEWMLHMEEIPLLPRTEEVLAFYAPSLRSVQTLWIVIPLLIVFYGGELVWRERDAGVSEIVDTSPVPEWVLFLGKFLGLGLVIAAWMAILMAAGMLVQVRLGYPEFDIGLYLKALFGFQLTDYLLFALLVLVVHTVVDQKHLGHVAALAAYGFVVFAPSLGIEHRLLVYGSDLGWSHTPMAGFGPFIGPWLWFKLYWAAWAVLLAVAARLFVARGREAGLGVRFHMARHRFTRATAGVTTTAVALIVAAGGFIFYNTNVLNAYRTAAEWSERRAEYERRYGQYEGIPQPQLTGITLHVEILPERREVEIRGTYRLVNNSSAAIDSIHLATAPGVTTGEAAFDRPARPAVVDDDLNYRIYSLAKPLPPGDSVELRFDVRDAPRGFTNDGVDADVAANGTYINNLTWLPAIGYRANRELNDAVERRAHGLAPQPAIPSLDDTEATRVRVERVSVETIVGTAHDQTAVAPGALRRTWTDPSTGSGQAARRYFHYATDTPIGNEYALFSAKYALHEAEWSTSGQKVAIQVFHHPGHTQNLDRTVRSAQASLSYYTTEFGPYPFRHVRFIEHPGRGRGMHADNNTVDYQEGFSLLNPRPDFDPDLPFAVIAHEVAHQWWGTQLAYARVEGAGVLSESLATYSSMRLIEETLSAEQLRRYLRFLRLEYQLPRSRALPPLLRATDRFLFYRKGPLALYGLSEYIGKERVHEALRRLLEKHRSGEPPLPTTLDLYRELKVVTPDEFQTLLHDLFEVNAFWDLWTDAVRAEPTAAGQWQLTLDVRARKTVVDLEGREAEVPMDEWIEIGVYAQNGEVLYLQKHRIGAGKQTITVTVSREPDRAGIDPRYLLNDWNVGDNVMPLKPIDDGFP